MKDLSKRLKRIEQRITGGDPIQVLCADENGTEIVTDVDCMINNGYLWKKVVSGGNMQDFRRMFYYSRRQMMDEITYEQYKKTHETCRGFVS